MINEAMVATRYELNTFTTKLAEYCKVNGKAHVKMRNNKYLYITVSSSDDLDEDDRDSGFCSPDHKYAWWPDGSSLTTRDWDIVECNDLK